LAFNFVPGRTPVLAALGQVTGRAGAAGVLEACRGFTVCAGIDRATAGDVERTVGGRDDDAGGRADVDRVAAVTVG